MEYDLKTGQPHRSRETGNRVVLLAREDSLERLQEEGQEQFPDITTLEELTDVREDIRLLRHALLELEEKELNLIISLYYKGLSEREYSQKTGIPQRTIDLFKSAQRRAGANVLACADGAFISCG